MICFVAFWIGSGLAGFAFFHYKMKKLYPDQDDDNYWDGPEIPLQLVMAVLAGPINWFAIAVILELASQEDDKDG